MNIYDIVPIPKPRMTQRDKWQQRDCVMKYRAFKDECRMFDVVIPEAGSQVIFVLPMPKSWSKKKKDDMDGKPHRAKKDVDNLLKALLDAVFPDDSSVWDIRITKRWGESGKIIILGADE